jgi:hypothetical protein
MSWDLNDDEFNSSGGANKIFNNGQVGITENCRAEVTKKAADANAKAPDFSVTFYDSEDRHVNIGFWLGNDTSDWTDGKRKIYGARLKHLAHTFLGEDFKFPKYESYDDMVVGILKDVKTACANVPVRVFTNHGTDGYENDFPAVRFAPPFIESMSVALEETSLTVKKNDVMTRPTADKEEPATADADSDW